MWGRGWSWSNAVFSCCPCPAGELKTCFSVSATEQQQNQYSKHCKRNTPSADVHGIFPNCFFFFLFGLILTLSSPLLSFPPPRVLLVLLFQLVFWLCSVRVPVLLWVLVTASQALGWGCWAELWWDVRIAACLDFPLCHPCIVLCPVQLVLLALGRLVWKKSGPALSTLQQLESWGWTTPQKKRAGKGYSEEALDSLFGLLSCVLDPLH